MRRSAAALLANPPPPPQPLAGLEAVRAAVEQAVRAVERKLAAARAAAPRLALAAPALAHARSAWLSSQVFSGSAPALTRSNLAGGDVDDAGGSTTACVKLVGGGGGGGGAGLPRLRSDHDLKGLHKHSDDGGRRGDVPADGGGGGSEHGEGSLSGSRNGGRGWPLLSSPGFGPVLRRPGGSGPIKWTGPPALREEEDAGREGGEGEGHVGRCGSGRRRALGAIAWGRGWAGAERPFARVEPAVAAARRFTVCATAQSPPRGRHRLAAS